MLLNALYKFSFHSFSYYKFLAESKGKRICKIKKTFGKIINENYRWSFLTHSVESLILANGCSENDTRSRLLWANKAVMNKKKLLTKYRT